ncbi:hypothetical protein F5887DRAFT_1072789 [Amanita rubescens]|nr:hypothetical protein F5887DRAFT_1072789 [Amanita rubescens]
MPTYAVQSISTGKFVSDDDDFGSVKITATGPNHSRLHFSEPLEGPETLTIITGQDGWYVSIGAASEGGGALFWLPTETTWKVVSTPHGYQISATDGPYRDFYWYPNSRTIHLVPKSGIADLREVSFRIFPSN